MDDGIVVIEGLLNVGNEVPDQITEEADDSVIHSASAKDVLQNVKNALENDSETNDHHLSSDTDVDTGGIPVDPTNNIPTSISEEEPEVIGLLLQTHDHAADEDLSEDVDPQNFEAVSLPDQQIIPGDTGQTIQAVTLADGTTAFIQHPKGRKFLEGQTITLEDGSTAVVQGVSQVSSLPGQIPSESTDDSPRGLGGELDEDQQIGEDGHLTGHMAEGQPVQLEDGTTAFLTTTPKEGLQAIQLEDGTTAYISHPTPEALFGDAATLDSSPLNLEQLAAQVSADQLKADIGTGQISKSDAVNVMSNANNHGIVGSITVIAAGLAGDGKTINLGEKAYKCSFEGCGRLYTTHHHLKVHERSHTGDRPFKCDFLGCNKAFATGYGLKSHTRVHTGEKPYKCPETSCDKAFKTSGDLQKHVRTHTGERPFKCPFEGCTRSFTTSNIRKVHIRTHTGERPYVCQEEGCGRAFASATNYKNHIRIHTGEKPYVCTVPGCGKRFTEYSSLYKHHVVHTHSKPYICNHCGKTYRQTSTLAMHKRTAHGEDVTPESEAQLFAQQQENQDEDDDEPAEKRAKFEYALSTPEHGINGQDDNNSNIISTSEAQQITDASLISGELGNDEAAAVVGLQQAQQTQQNMLEQLHSQPGVATITVGDQNQQVYVITDPVQLEALQQLAQQQLDSQDPSSILTQDDSIDTISVADSNIITSSVNVVNSIITSSSADTACAAMAFQ